jgi:glutamyl-tRNA reductase
MHAPSANLRAAAQRGDVELLRAAEQLFDAGPDSGAPAGLALDKDPAKQAK